eukprot:3636919-Pleurochrysis_carterae.AAC.3
MRLSLDAVVTCDELVPRTHFGPIVDGQSSWPFARQTRGDVTPCVCMVSFYVSSRPPTYAGAHGLRTRLERATERVLWST